MFVKPRHEERPKREFDAPKALAHWISKSPRDPLDVVASKVRGAKVRHSKARSGFRLRYLFVEFSEKMQLRDGCVYIGRGYALASKRRVTEFVRHCYKDDYRSHLIRALSNWDALKDSKTPGAADQFTVTETEFGSFLEVHLQRLERCVKTWFRPRRNAPGIQTNPKISVYAGLPDDIKLIVLYLAFRLQPSYWRGLRDLVCTLDWQHFARVLRNPAHVPACRPNEKRTVDELRQVLARPVRIHVCRFFQQQPMVAHRALAQEYEYITGCKLGLKPSGSIQDKMLGHKDGTGSGLSAICLSGGGIRSASFCLGAIQALCCKEKFGSFHYMSTVSGGGYIGTALIRWMAAKVRDDGTTPQRAVDFAQTELANLRCADYVQHRMTGIDFEQEGPLTWLRMNSNYLARQLSLFSADAWTVVATYLRNLVIVWTIFFPWIAVYVMLPWTAVWLGQFQLIQFGPVPVAIGVVGSVLGVLGASYFFQGEPGAVEKIYANHIPFPRRSGDARAAWGALLLVMACYSLSVTLWSETDTLSEAERSAAWPSLMRYGYVVTAIVVTQMTLAERNIDHKRWSGRVMLGAALVGSVVQIALIVWIRWGLHRWPPIIAEKELGTLIDLPLSAMRWRAERTDASLPSHLLTLGSTIRALVTPPLLLVALLLGEGMKAAVRSFTETPDRREHQARAHAFSFMLATAWIAGSMLVIGVPALLTYFGPSTPAVTAAGSAVSVAASAWFGYRKSSPGKPEARTPISLSLVGAASLTLLAIFVSIGAWKVFEFVSTDKDWTHPVRCECAKLDATYRLAQTPTRINRPGFSTPVDESMCALTANQCIDRTFTSYFDDFISAFKWTRVLKVLASLAAAGATLYGLSFIVRMNEFSLHGFYRDRLIRAFYGGFRAFKMPRAPALFTGFDPNDDLSFYKARVLYPASSKKMAGTSPAKPPFLVVNTALNLVKGNELAWQERKADSFTLTALHGGNYRLGYRRIRCFAGGVKLGTAMAISGAAFNPNMGYNSSAPMAFLMSVLNVRLGWWLGNPKFKEWQKKDPSCSSWRLLQEAAGETTDTSDWIHLSDGGHFDNLGLWEMVHRRCRRILVLDASQDGRFTMEDFYSAIRKIRIDMGIVIEEGDAPVLLFPRSARASGMYFARFVIRYSRANCGASSAELDGELVYMKPCIYGNEPLDIRQYAEKHPDFPHESTADQFFNESQFESYRKLGEWEMKKLLCECPDIWSAPQVVKKT
ncbi:patatin-like phospholipase family protein [Caballeronia sp. M1242]|uniref:patatin-like phospholipase family protein n=1 Tax=Caballeronia sp. M1242 TaxID=2814653 RepID=UPI001F49DCEB|nr:patatin-like phospholipase family protein [Caballeronia sp. M1242]